MNIITIILSLFGTKPAKVLSIISNLTSLILAGVVIGFIYKTNAYVEDRTYGGVEELLRLTNKPWLLIVFSILQSICLRFKMKQSNSYIYTPIVNQTMPQKQCNNCGAYISDGAMFCNRCGAKTEIPNIAAKYCINCGNKIVPGTVFCNFCGAKLNKESKNNEG